MNMKISIDIFYTVNFKRYDSSYSWVCYKVYRRRPVTPTFLQFSLSIDILSVFSTIVYPHNIILRSSSILSD